MVLLTALAPSVGAAHAQGRDAPPSGSASAFSSQGQWVITDSSLSLHVQGNHSDFVLRPALDVFIAPQVSVGGYVQVDTPGSNIGFGARAGYALALGSWVTFWPTAGLLYTHGTGNAHYDVVDLQVFAPFLFHLVPHFFLGIGPVVNFQVKGGRDPFFGLDSVIGGNFSW